MIELTKDVELLPQDPDDEPAGVLLEKIKEEKERLIKAGEIRNHKPIPKITEEEMPYEIPKSWKWSRLHDIGLINPRNSAQDDLDASFVPMPLISAEYGVKVQSEKRLWKEIKNGYTHFKENDVSLAKITPCFENGKSTVMRGLKNGIGAGTTELHVFRPILSTISPDYVLIYLKSPKFINEGIPRMTGSAGQKRVPKEYFAENPFPLPPTLEQKRIVSKVDRLMAFCDELEKNKEKRESKRISLNNACLDKLLSSREPEEFQEHWQRIVDHFDILYHHPGNVAKLKQAILQLAVMGKLVPQDPDDEPAEVLLEKIKQEKEQLIKEGKIKRQKPLPPITEDEKPFELPKGWEWVRLGDITKKLGAGSTPRGGKAVYRNKGVKFLRSQNVWNEGLRIDDVAYITEKIHENMSGTHVKPGDILLNITGASIGRSAVVPDDFDEGNVSQHVSIVRLVEKSSKAFIHLAIISPYIKDMVFSVQVGISREGLSMSRLQFFPIPFPTLNEQKRIAAKVEQLLSLCDRLAERLQEADSKRDKLFQAVVNQVLD